MEHTMVTATDRLYLLLDLYHKAVRRGGDDIAVDRMQETIDDAIEMFDGVVSESRHTKEAKMMNYWLAYWLAYWLKYDAECDACDIEAEEETPTKNGGNMGRPRKYPQGEAPTPVERTADYLAKLREAGGRTRSYNWRPSVVQALDVLKASPEHQFKDETALISDVIIAAAAAVLTSK